MDLQEFSEQVLVPLLGLVLVTALPLFELFLCQAAAAELPTGCAGAPLPAPAAALLIREYRKSGFVF